MHSQVNFPVQESDLNLLNKDPFAACAVQGDIGNPVTLSSDLHQLETVLWKDLLQFAFDPIGLPQCQRAAPGSYSYSFLVFRESHIKTIIPLVSRTEQANTISVFEKIKSDSKPALAWLLIGYINGDITDYEEDQYQIKFYAINVKINYVLLGLGFKVKKETWQNEIVILSKPRGIFRGQVGFDSISGLWITFTRA